MTAFFSLLPTFWVLQFRFTLLCHAACEAPLVLPLGGFTYGKKCVFLANDWHAGLVPVYVINLLRTLAVIVYISSFYVSTVHVSPLPPNPCVVRVVDSQDLQYAWRNALTLILVVLPWRLYTLRYMCSNRHVHKRIYCPT